MRVVIQRVSRASVSINSTPKEEIGHGMLILLGIETVDSMDDVDWLANKIVRLRIFDDTEGVMNHPVTMTGGEILVVSQFTLHAKTKKGNRPSYIRAAHPDLAVPLYESFVHKLRNLVDTRVVTGEFGAKMSVELVNDGPVTIIIDTQNRE